MTVSPSRRALTIRRRRSLRRTSTTAGLTTDQDYPRPVRPTEPSAPAAPSCPQPGPACGQPDATERDERDPPCMTWSPSALPRRLRLPPHRSLLLRGPSARLLGLDPRTALVVDDLPPPLARMLDELVAPVERVGLVARAVQPGRGPRRGRGAARAAGRQRSARRCGRAGPGGPAACGGGRDRRRRRPARGRDRGGARARGRRQCVGRGRPGRSGAGARPRHGPARRRPRPAPGRGDRRRRPAGRTGHERRAAAGPGRSRPVRARRRRRPGPLAASRPCTATGSRTCPCGCATARGSSDRWCCRAARRAWRASSCTGAAAIPAGRPSRPSSSGSRAGETLRRRPPPRRWVWPRCWRRWTPRRAERRPRRRCSARRWSSTSPRAGCCAAGGRRTRTARVVHHHSRRHAGRALERGTIMR